MTIRISPTDTSFTYLCDWQYNQLTFSSSPVDTSAEGFALFFMMMDEFVFGHTDFVLTDTLLFSDRLKDSDTTLRVVHLLNTSGTAGRGNVLIYEECLQFIVCGSPNSSYCTGPNGCDYLNCVADPDVCGILEICWEHEIGGGGSGNPPGGGGGNPPGGGGSGNPPGGDPPPCGTGKSQRTSLVSPCGPGWVPIPVPGGGSSPPEPIDSLLARYSRAIKDTAIYIYDNLSQPNNIEYAFTGIQANGQIAVIERRTNNDSIQVIPMVMIGNLTLLFTWHSHVSTSTDLTKRGSFSPDDIDMLRNVRCLKQNFISFADCRNKRYALVITDVGKAIAFFNNNDYYKILSNYTTTVVGNTQEIDEASVKNVIGTLAANGIGFYVSNDSPGFQTWILLNP